MGVNPRDLPPNLRRSFEELDRQHLAKLRERCPEAFRRAGGPKRSRRVQEPAPALLLHPAGTVLAIDPSIRDMGWAVLTWDLRGPVRRDSGIWHPSAAKGTADRWVQMHRFLVALARTHRPGAAVVECPSRIRFRQGEERSQRSLINYGRAMQGAFAALLAGLEGIAGGGHVYAPDVDEWKGKKRKGSTSAEVRLRLGHEPADHNESDALGLGLWFMDNSGRPRQDGAVVVDGMGELGEMRQLEPGGTPGERSSNGRAGTEQGA